MPARRRGFAPDPNVDARSEIRLERRAGGLRHADDGDRDVRIVPGHSGRQGGGHVVGDDEGDRSGRLSVGRLLDEEAVAAVHERNAPVDRGRVRVRGTAVGRRRTDRVGGVDRLDELSADRDLADVGTERRGPEVEIAGDRRGGVHREHGQRAQHAGRLRAHGGPVPEDVPRVHVRRGALGRRHVGPVLAGRLVEDHGLEDVGLIEEFGARRVVDQGQESETVAELVEEDGDEIEAVAVLGVEAVVPGRALEATGLPDAGVEPHRDVVRTGDQVGPRELVRQRRRVPRAAQGSVRRVGDDGVRKRAAERPLVRRAGQRIEGRADADLDGSVEQLAPDLGRALERDQTLLADGRAGVAADRSGRPWDR